MRNKYIQHIARFVSIVGHPLWTISLLVWFLSHQQLPKKKANMVSLLIIGCVAIPILLHNIWKTKKGEYSNFDVSNQQERKRFFPFAIGLLAMVTLYFYLTDAHFSLVASCVCFLVMLVLFALINLRLKASLHAGINFYIAAIMLHYHLSLGFAILLLAAMVAFSRLILKRHSLIEILIGASIGFIFGSINSGFL